MYFSRKPTPIIHGAWRALVQPPDVYKPRQRFTVFLQPLIKCCYYTYSIKFYGAGSFQQTIYTPLFKFFFLKYLRNRWSFNIFRLLNFLQYNLRNNFNIFTSLLHPLILHYNVIIYSYNQTCATHLNFKIDFKRKLIIAAFK